MNAAAITTDIEAAIFARVIDPANGSWSPEVAQAILSLSLPPEDRQRMDELAAKARAGSLEPDDELQIEGYRHVCRVLELMKAKSRTVLKPSTAA